MAEQDSDKDFVEYVVKAIVAKPEAVKVDKKLDAMGVLIELTVDAEDMGKIIGKQGQTAKALRTLLRVLGAKSKARINLKIIEPVGGRVMKEEDTEVKEDKKVKEDKEEEKATEIV